MIPWRDENTCMFFPHCHLSVNSFLEWFPPTWNNVYSFHLQSSHTCLYMQYMTICTSDYVSTICIFIFSCQWVLLLKLNIACKCLVSLVRHLVDYVCVSSKLKTTLFYNNFQIKRKKEKKTSVKPLQATACYRFSLNLLCYLMFQVIFSSYYWNLYCVI